MVLPCKHRCGMCNVVSISEVGECKDDRPHISHERSPYRYGQPSLYCGLCEERVKLEMTMRGRTDHSILPKIQYRRVSMFEWSVSWIRHMLGYLLVILVLYLPLLLKKYGYLQKS